MNKLEKWTLRKIVNKALNSNNIEPSIQEIYSIIEDCTKSRFTEDNIPTIQQYLRDNLKKDK